MSHFSPLLSGTWHRVPLPFLVIVLLMAAAPSRAISQITAESLIGDAVSDPDSSRYSNVREAIKRFNNRDILAARQFLERAKEDDSRLPPTDLTLAKMYLLSGQSAPGRAALEQTVRDNPGDPESYLIVADQLYAQGRMIEAEALYDKVIRLLDSFTANEKRKHRFTVRARAGRSAVAERRQDWTAAVDDLTVWVENDPENASAHHRLGRALFLSDNIQKGFEHIGQAHQLDDSLPSPYVTAALLYVQLGQDEKAKQTFEKAIQTDGNDAQALVAYAQWLIQSGDIEQAESKLQSARRAAPESLEALTLSGVAAKIVKKMKPAEDYLLEALSISPTNSSVLNQLALLLIDQPDDAKRRRALQFAQINARLHPDSSEANITLAWVLYQLGQNANANQAFQKGIQLGNLNVDSRYLISKMLVAQGRNSDAKRVLSEALDSEQGIFVHRDEAQALLNSLN